MRTYQIGNEIGVWFKKRVYRIRFVPYRGTILSITITNLDAK